jgi:hypothetical protein
VSEHRWVDHLLPLGGIAERGLWVWGAAGGIDVEPHTDGGKWAAYSRQ